MSDELIDVSNANPQRVMVAGVAGVALLQRAVASLQSQLKEEQLSHQYTAGVLCTVIDESRAERARADALAKELKALRDDIENREQVAYSKGFLDRSDLARDAQESRARTVPASQDDARDAVLVPTGDLDFLLDQCESAMNGANRDGAEWDIESELAPFRAIIAAKKGCRP